VAEAKPVGAKPPVPRLTGGLATAWRQYNRRGLAATVHWAPIGRSAASPPVLQDVEDRLRAPQPDFRHFHDGASRTRTGDLLGAIHSPYAGGNRVVQPFLAVPPGCPNTFPNTLRAVLQLDNINREHDT